MKTSPILIKCLHGILRVAITGILNQSRYLVKEQPVNNCWDWYFCNINNPVIFTTASHAKNGNQRHMPLLHNPHSPLQLDLLKDKSLPWLSFFLLQAPSPKLIHNAFQSVCLSVFASGAYVITFVGFWQRCVMFKRGRRVRVALMSPALSGLQLCAYQICFLCYAELCWHTMLPLNFVLNI